MIDAVFTEDVKVVTMDELGRPTGLLGGGHFISGVAHNSRRTIVGNIDIVPMDERIQSVKDQNLMHPKGRKQKSCE
eukprot:12432657-Ditylum_brightwellii.AAC.1